VVTSLGSIFIDIKGIRIKIGRLVYEPKHLHAMLGLDLANLLPVCRETDEERIQGCCIPYPSVDDPPFLSHDLQWCGPKDKRTKLGWVYTDSDERGPAYQVILFVPAVMKIWDCAWLHLHELSEEELKQQAEEKDEQANPKTG